MSRKLTPIGHCSAKLRRRLEIEEEEALGFTIKIRRRGPEDEVARGAMGGRWYAAPNFAAPGPFGDRPVSPEGFVSFHYGITIVSRSPCGKSVVSTSRGKVTETDRPLGDHDQYVSRPGAVMTIRPAEYDQYAARAHVTDLTTGQAQIALVSNISLDPVVRASFWHAVDDTARKAGPDRLILDPARGSKKEWTALAAAGDLPAELGQMVTKIAAGERTRKAEFPMPAAAAKTTVELICRHVPNADRKKGPVRFARGRKGRTQYRLETELPDGLDNAARVRIMFKMAEAVEETGAMYTLALHEPDEHNDDRNFHLHLVAHDRPATLIDGKWDFTITELVEGQSGRVRFSERKKKIVVEKLKTATSRGDFEAFLKELRRQFADFCNAELRAAGQKRLFDPRKYTEMGIDREPTKPLGTRLAPLEAAGVPTKVGIANAEIIWNYELRTRLQRCQAARLVRHETLARTQAAVDRMSSHDPGTAASQALVERARHAAALLDIVEPELAEYEVTLAMARARPAKVIDTCSRILKEIEVGRGSSTDRRNRSRIEQRRDDAAAFLGGLDRIDRANQKVIGDQRPAIDRARSDFAAAAELVASLQASPPPRGADVGVTTPVSRTKSLGETPPAAEKVALVQAPRVDPAAQVKRDPSDAASIEHVGPVNLWAVIERIIHDRLAVLGPEHHGGDGYRAVRVKRDELRVLRTPELFELAQTALARVAKQQAEEIDAAYLVYRSHGRLRAEEVAAAETGRPLAAQNPLGVLKAYADHPYAARLMGWESPLDQRRPDDGQSIWRRIRSTVSQALLPAQNAAVVDYASDAGDELTSVHPEALVIPDEAPSPEVSREAAIEAYAQVIRTDPRVVLVTTDGLTRVDPESVPDWGLSARAWEDHDLVKAAVETRWAEEREKDRQMERIESFRAAKRVRIVAELQTGRMVARLDKGHWLITGTDADLVFFARKWRDNPELLAAFANSAQRAPSGPTVVSNRSAPRSTAPAASLPQAGAATKLGAPASALPGPRQSAVGYTPSQQQEWMRDRQSGISR